jgi:hypothetical protein
MFAGRMPLNSNWLESPGWGWATSLPWQTNNRRLLGELCRSALRSLTRYFEFLAGRELMPGVIAAIQTFGDRINLHPHLHFLVTEGGVDEAGAFHYANAHRGKIKARPEAVPLRMVEEELR